ncbi:MAG: hypothetical protein ACJA1E_001030 [Paracoccaceae bacterium]|jgi:hypothetical protein
MRRIGGAVSGAVKHEEQWMVIVRRVRLWGLVSLLAVSMLAMPSSVRAEFTLIDRADAWFFYTQRGVGQRNAACQLVSCVRGLCDTGASSRTQFSLYNARDGRGIRPEFIAPSRAASSDVAVLELNGKTFALQNQFQSPQFYMQVRNSGDADQIVDGLRALEARDRSGKFFVVDPKGRRHQFTVQGITESLSRMARRCTPRG